MDYLKNLEAAVDEFKQSTDKIKKIETLLDALNANIKKVKEEKKEINLYISEAKKFGDTLDLTKKEIQSYTELSSEAQKKNDEMLNRVFDEVQKYVHEAQQNLIQSLDQKIKIVESVRDELIVKHQLIHDEVNGLKDNVERLEDAVSHSVENTQSLVREIEESLKEEVQKTKKYILYVIIAIVINIIIVLLH